MTGYKLTDQNMQTYNGTRWQIGKWKKTDGKGELCGPGWLHYYSDPLLAVLLNPIHADFQNPRLFEAEISGETKEDNGLKFGCTKMRVVKELQLPAVTVEQCIKFAIYCTLEVYEDPAFIKWANNWLNGTDRTTQSAGIAKNNAEAASDTSNVVAKSAAGAAFWAARAAYWAAECVVWTFGRGVEISAKCLSEDATFYAIKASLWAVRVKDIDLIALAEKAMQYQFDNCS